MFIGEIPFVGSDPEPKFSDAWDTLSYLYHKHGLRTWFGMLRRMARCKLTGRPVIIHDGKSVSFYASPEAFICDGTRRWAAACPLLAARISQDSE